MKICDISTTEHALLVMGRAGSDFLIYASTLFAVATFYFALTKPRTTREAFLPVFKLVRGRALPEGEEAEATTTTTTTAPSEKMKALAREVARCFLRYPTCALSMTVAAGLVYLAFNHPRSLVKSALRSDVSAYRRSCAARAKHRAERG
ncbi:hypothetical protein F4818DRAFT_438905 [Hypoxylon cercidicola]|nr:hypothetical protein F4818DRAFT_438905 [Hypoxylon cercidicola]